MVSLFEPPSAEQAAELGRGITPGPGGDTVLYYRALLYERMGKRSEMLADLSQLAFSKTASLSLRRMAQERLEAANSTANPKP